MKTPALLLALGPALAARLLAVEGAPPAAAPAPVDPPVPAEVLAVGERVFRADCATCHVRGKAGAPRVGHPDDWTKRLAHGRATLVKRAIQGYSGPAGDEMPARGGNDELTDAEVSAAVSYILHLLTNPPAATPAATRSPVSIKS